MSSSAQSATTICFARPPVLPPSYFSADSLIRRVYIRHPGYDRHNVLLALPAVDGLPADDHSLCASRAGLHHRTALTAGAIIANNAFARAYLTRDRAGRDRVDASIPLDGMLRPGDYWLQLKGEDEEGDSSPPQRDGDHDPTTGPEMSMSPPPPPLASNPNPNPSTPRMPPTQSPAATPTTSEPYPIVPSFRDWLFPHDELPPDWTAHYEAPSRPAPTPQSTPTDPTPISSRCWITASRLGLNGCHIIPEHLKSWFGDNGMAVYAANPGASVITKDKRNIVPMRSDLHAAFDQHRFAIVPKPSSPGSHALVIHVLYEDVDELVPQYHNVAIQSQNTSGISREFAFARFALAIFHLIRNFLDSTDRRHLAVMMSEDSGQTTRQFRWMNRQDLQQHRDARNESRNGYRKRSSSQMTRDEADEPADDAYQERRERRSYSLGDLGSADASNLEPDQRQVEENTRWYNEVGRFAAFVHPDERQLEDNTRWYEENISPMLDSSCDWDEEDPEVRRGRARHRGLRHRKEDAAAHRDVPSSPLCGASDRELSSPDPEGLPTLSRSFTTTGSNRSSAWLNLERPSTPNQTDSTNHTLPGDKLPGASGDGDFESDEASQSTRQPESAGAVFPRE